MGTKNKVKKKKNRPSRVKDTEVSLHRRKVREILTKEFLKQKRIKERLSVEEISAQTGFEKYTIKNRLVRFNICAEKQRRTIPLKTRFGKLTVIKRDENHKNNSVMYECICDCGVTSHVSRGNLISHGTKSCGCVRCGKGENSWFWKGFKELPGRYWSIVKSNAKKRDLEFLITIEYAWNVFIKQSKRCALSGIPIDFSNDFKNYKSQTASLDRIDSSKGYIEGNIQWVHKDINLMKMDLSQEYFIKMCSEVYLVHNQSQPN